MTEETEKLDRIEGLVTHLIHLVRSGGKESRVTECVPAWTAADADGECEFTGIKLPKKRLVMHASIRVHPGVADYAAEREIEDLTAVPDTVIPDDYLVVPFNIEFRAVYRPPTTVIWEKAQIDSFTRPAMMYLCGQLHIQQILEARGVPKEEADFRRQTNGWLVDVLHAIADGVDIPGPLTIGTVPPGRKAKPAKLAKPAKRTQTPVEELTDASEGSESKNDSTGKVEAPPSPKSPEKASTKSKTKVAKKKTAKAAKKSGGSKTKPTATSASSKPKVKKAAKPAATPAKSKVTAKKTSTSTKGKSAPKKKAAKKSSSTKPASAKKPASKKSGKKKAAKKSSSSQELAPKKKKPARKKTKGKK